MDALERIGFDRLGLVVTPGGTTTSAVSAPPLAAFAHVGVRVANPEAITDGRAPTRSPQGKNVVPPK